MFCVNSKGFAAYAFKVPTEHAVVSNKNLSRRRVYLARFRLEAASDKSENAVIQAVSRLASPLEIMDEALKTYGDDAAIAFSGAEDVALIEYAHLTKRPFRVFSLDTGRLNSETYQFFDEVEKHYNIKIEYTFPDASETMALVRNKGLFSFYKDGHKECCSIRKVRPLRRQLKTLKAWITGQRKDQSPGTRDSVPVIQIDPVFEGLDGGPGSLMKFNPLSNLSSKEVWNFLRVMNVPINKLHSCGFTSIGCEPCTRAVLPNQHEREGRWWWEDTAQKECGLHAGNVVTSSNIDSDEARSELYTSKNVQTLTREQVMNVIDHREAHTLIVLYAPWCKFSQAMEDEYNMLADEHADGLVHIAKFRADTDREFAKNKFGLSSFPSIYLLPKNSSKIIKYSSERRTVESWNMWLNSLLGTKF